MDNVISYDSDILSNLKEIFQNHIIDSIIHIGTDYWRRDKNFYQIIESNLMLPIQLIELWIQYKVSSFLNTDTFRDEHIDLPVWLSYYAYSKKDFIKYAKKMIKESNIKFINIKLQHLYWPKDNHNKFIPSIITSLLKNISNIDLTKGEQEKDFIYIDDVISAYLCIMNNLSIIHQWYEEFELWCWEGFSIKDLITKINNIIESKTTLNFWGKKYRKWESMRSVANIDKITKLGRRPIYNLDQGIRETINYFRSIT